MKKTVIPFVLSTIGIALGQGLLNANSAQASGFSHLYAFGDSFIDTGNLYALTGYPPSPFYDNGRFSDGPVFVEYMANQLKLDYDPNDPFNPNDDFDNFAYGGAQTTDLSGDGIPDLDLQVNSFVGDRGILDANALYVIWADGNDYSHYLNNNQPPDIQAVVDRLASSITTLSDAGAKNFLVFGAIDYNYGPYYANASQPMKDILTQIATQHNLLLASTLQGLEQDTLGLDFTFVDANPLLADVVSNPGYYGLTNTTEACLDENFNICANPSEYLFWDGGHPSTVTHRILANYALDAIDDGPTGGVPEPLTLLGVGTAVSFGTFFKRSLSKLKK